MQWETVLGNTGYIKTIHALIPTYRLPSGELLLFDSGPQPDPKLLAELERLGLRVRAVLCTHLHIDHIANNQALVERHGAEILAHAEELPLLLSRQEAPYPITTITEGPVNIGGVQVGVIPTPGHSPGHLAYVTPDGVCCIGDSMMSLRLLQHAKMPYMEDVDRSILTMEALRQTRYPFYIAAHKAVVPLAELPDLVEANIQKELDLYALLRRSITAPLPMEEAVTAYLLAAGIRAREMLEMFYVRHTAKVRLEALSKAGEFTIKEGVIAPNHR